MLPVFKLNSLELLMRLASTSIDKFFEPSCVPGSATPYVRANQTPLSMHLVPPAVDAFSGRVESGANWWEAPDALDWFKYCQSCEQYHRNASFWSWREHDDRRYWYVVPSPALFKTFGDVVSRLSGYCVTDDFGNLAMVEGPAR